MRVVDKKTFMELPKNTLYCKCQRYGEVMIEDAYLSEMCVKTSNFGTFGFRYIPLSEMWPEGQESDYTGAFERMLINPAVEYPGVLKEYRDDDTPDDMKFIIFGRHEINQLIKLLESCIRRIDKFGKKNV